MTDTPPDGTEPPSEPEVDPEQVGADLFRRLDILDDRLQRSQEKMLSLLDQKLNGLQGPGPSDGSAPAAGERAPAPPEDAPAPPAEAAPLPEAERVADQTTMEAWFGGAPTTTPAPASPRASSPAPVSLPATSPAPSGWGRQIVGTPEGAALDPSPAAPPAAPTALQGVDIVPAHRPAWQSNALAVVVTALVVVVGLFLVGLF